MKKYLFLLLISFFNTALFAQRSPNCDGGDWGGLTIDSVSFESFNAIYSKIFIDTSFLDNLFQLGTVTKNGFPTAHSGTQALQTDTLNPYTINNESAVIIYTDSVTGSSMSDELFSLTFWHYFDTDTLTDSCILQISIDSGKNWSNVIGNTTLFGAQIYYSGSLDNNAINSSDDTLVWTGKSDGWQKESVCIFILGVKGIQLPKLFGFRFLFHSDSVQTNKPGWMIDDVVTRTPQGTFDVKNLNKNSSVIIYPNPSENGIFNIDYPHNYITGKIELYNIYGQKIKELKLAPTINVTDLLKGLYHYNILFYNTQQRFTGTIEYN